MSAPSVHDRVAKLERDGIIRGYVTNIDPAAFGADIVALVGIYLSSQANVNQLVELLKDFGSIEDCYVVAGEESLVIKVRVNSVASLESLLGKIQTLPAVGRVRTNLVLSQRWSGHLNFE